MMTCQRSDPNCPTDCPYWVYYPDEDAWDLYGTEICPMWVGED